MSIETIVQEIERALDAKLYYLAITASLTLPDICAALEAPTGQSNGPAYKTWYDMHLSSLYPKLTSEDCWRLRCGTIHQGRFGHPDMQYDRVIFTFPGSSSFSGHNNTMQWPDFIVLQLDANIFCRDFVNAVRQWFANEQSSLTIQANLPRLIQLHPNGLLPRIVGFPLVA